MRTQHQQFYIVYTNNQIYAINENMNQHQTNNTKTDTSTKANYAPNLNSQKQALTSPQTDFYDIIMHHTSHNNTVYPTVNTIAYNLSTAQVTEIT